jgi:hypothetical protein
MKKLIAESTPVVSAAARHLWWAAVIALIVTTAEPASAVVPIPDQVFYGTIAIQNRAVTNNAAGTNVVIEARRASDGRLLTSYRMGTSTSQGRLFYVLRIPMEDSPVSSLDLVAPEDTLTLIVKRGSTVQFASNSVPLASGSATRIDFGVSVDTDGNGVPDGWELGNFGASGGNLNRDADLDGVSDYAEYVAGTSPTDANDVFRLASANFEDHTVQITFTAKKAQGAGYEGRTRYYSLETATELGTPAWRTVTNYSRIQGNNQTVVFTAATTNAQGAVLFRGRVWLEGP